MKKFLGILKDIAICFIVAFLINRFVFMFAFVPTGSMKPTIMEKDRIIVDRISLLFDEIERGDIVVFESNAMQGEKLLVKRVIGLPGESVEIKEGKVYINDVPFDEEYVYYPDSMSMEKIEIGEDKYFMLGDNRSNSFDARFWDDKTIDKKEIIGFARLFRKR
jgi:signal peptidase I